MVGWLGRKQAVRARVRGVGWAVGTQGHAAAAADLFSGTNRSESNALFSFHSRQGRDRGRTPPRVWSKLTDSLKVKKGAC